MKARRDERAGRVEKLLADIEATVMKLRHELGSGDTQDRSTDSR